MKTQDSHIKENVIEIFPNEIGKLYFFKHLVIIEINEGVHVSYENASTMIIKIKSFFGGKLPMGIISNRINNYSVEVLDYDKLFKYMPNIKAFSVVYYNIQNSYNIEIEKSFSPVPFHGYNNIDDAIKNTLNIIKNNTQNNTKTA